MMNSQAKLERGAAKGRTPIDIPGGLITKGQLKARIGCCQRHIENLMAREAIPYHRFGHRVLFRWEDVLEATRILAATKVGTDTNTTATN